MQKTTLRLKPWTEKQVRLWTVTTLLLLAPFLVTLVLVIGAGQIIAVDPGIFTLGLISGGIGLPLAFYVFVWQVPASRAFWRSALLKKAVILRKEMTEEKHIAGGAAGAGEGAAGCLIVILELLFLALPVTTTYYHLHIQLDEQGSQHGSALTTLRATVTRELYDTISEGEMIEVQYDKSHPCYLLIGPEIRRR